MNDKEFIEKFKEIKSIKQISNKCGVNYYNIISGTAGYERTKQVADELEKELKDFINSRKKFKCVKKK